MSGSVVIDFPGCGEVNSSKDQNTQTITVTTDHCSPPGPQPLIPWWAWVLGAIIALAFILATAIVRYRRHERLQHEHAQVEYTRRAEVTAAHTNCPTCGTVYIPDTGAKSK